MGETFTCTVPSLVHSEPSLDALAPFVCTGDVTPTLGVFGLTLATNIRLLFSLLSTHLQSLCLHAMLKYEITDVTLCRYEKELDLQVLRLKQGHC